MSLSIDRSIDRSIYLSIYLSIRLSVCRSIKSKNTCTQGQATLPKLNALICSLVDPDNVNHNYLLCVYSVGLLHLYSERKVGVKLSDYPHTYFLHRYNPFHRPWWSMLKQSVDDPSGKMGNPISCGWTFPPCHSGGWKKSVFLWKQPFWLILFDMSRGSEGIQSLYIFSVCEIPLRCFNLTLRCFK